MKWPLLILVSAGAVACARVPQEAVELSVTVGRDLAEMHRANRELAQRFFRRLYDDIDAFVSEVYRPFIIRETMESLEIVEQIREAGPGSDLDPVDIMEIYAEETIAQIQTFHDELRTPVLQQETEVIAAIDEAYQRVQNANAVVTGHLASVRRVHDAQAEFLDRVGLEGARQRISSIVAGFSDSVAVLLEGARELGETTPDSVTFGDLLRALRQLTAASANDSSAAGANDREDEP